MIYVEIQNNIPVKSTDNKSIADKYFKNYITTDFEDYSPTNNMYKYKNNTIILNPDFEQEQAEEEAQRIAMLNLTSADVERAIYKAKGMDFDDIIAYLETQPLSEDGQVVVDIKALKIELKANNFYRGNPYVEQIGKILGFTDEQLTKFFETGDYKELINANQDD